MPTPTNVNLYINKYKLCILEIRLHIKHIHIFDHSFVDQQRISLLNLLKRNLEI